MDSAAVPRDEIEHLIEDSAIFTSLSPEARELLCDRFEPRTLPGGGVLMRQGEAADALYLVSVGRLRVSIERDDGTETVVAELSRGEVVGEMALITDDPRSATVTAVRDSQVLRLSTESFAELVRLYPNAQREITTNVVRRLVRSFREGHPTSPVVTIGVVPLDASPEVAEIVERLQRSFQRLTGAAGHVTESATIEALGKLDSVSADRLAGWFAEHEAGYAIVVYEASHEVGRWTEACIRQADLVLLVGSANSTANASSVERAVDERRRHLKSRLELVFVHPAGTRDPRGTHGALAGRDVDRHHHVRAGQDDDVDRAARLLLGRGVGVVFSGGGARGVAGIGVYRALLEHGVP